MAEHSPTPWRIADGMSETIVDAMNRVQASAANAETAALIVEAVNARMNLLNALSEEQERGYLLEEERDRLRDLVRRLIPAVKTAYIYEKKIGAEAIAACLDQGVPASGIVEVVDEWRDLLREAQESAAKEDDEE